MLHPRLTLAAAFAVAAVLSHASGGRAEPLPVSTPEQQGVASAGVLAFVNSLEAEVDAPHAFVLVRHGKVIARGGWSPHAPDSPHMLYSLSKSFTSTAIGILADEGKIDIDDPVLSFFPDDAPAAPSENLRAMRVRDLLSMTTGHEQDTLARITQGDDDNWPRAFLSFPVEHRPGAFFRYNTGATYMLSAIVRKITGKTVLEYLKPRLFDPLGISNPTWETDPRGTSVGGWGLSISTDDIAKFGQLYLQRGTWGGRQLVSPAWVRLATSPQTANGSNPDSDWNQGYGFQFWCSRHDAYRGDGAFGQFCLVMPEQDAVLAVTAGQGDMQRTLNLAWQHLLPAMHNAPLPAADDALTALTAKLNSLEHAPVKGDATSPLAAKITGKTYAFADNEAKVKSVSFEFNGDSRSVVITSDRGVHRYALGYNAWTKQTIHYANLGIPAASTTADQPVSASGAWTTPTQFTTRAWLTATPFRIDMTFDFAAGDDGSTVTMSARIHPLQGKAVTARGAAKP